ncbi:Tc toxin subunit A [Pseudomonas sp. NPDC098747]|uniref:Tc toxin subunit A n=1 Tax=Pseudomonas sp. NPDC098747 TaxID=3364487 RepID=UPI00383A88BD
MSNESDIQGLSFSAENAITELIDQGCSTVFDIAAMPCDHLLEKLPSHDKEQVKQIHELATSRVNLLTCLYRAMQARNEPIMQHLPKLGIHPQPEALSVALRQALNGAPDFDDLFPPRAASYANVSSIQSLFSPGRYLTELYKIARSLHTSDHPLNIDKRRPDMASIILNEQALTEKVPALLILNEILSKGLDTTLTAAVQQCSLRYVYNDYGAKTSIHAGYPDEATDPYRIFAGYTKFSTHVTNLGFPHVDFTNPLQGIDLSNSYSAAGQLTAQTYAATSGPDRVSILKLVNRYVSKNAYGGGQVESIKLRFGGNELDTTIVEINFEYNEFGLERSRSFYVNDNRKLMMEYTYTPDSVLSTKNTTFGNNQGVMQSFAYDGINQLDISTIGNTTNNKTIDYNFKGFSRLDGTSSATLPATTTPSTTFSFLYDRVSQYTEKTSESDPGVVKTYGYDINGNVSTDPSGNTLMFNSANQLVEFKTSGEATASRYLYDALGRLNQIISPDGNSALRYVYDDSALVGEVSVTKLSSGVFEKRETSLYLRMGDILLGRLRRQKNDTHYTLEVFGTEVSGTVRSVLTFNLSDGSQVGSIQNYNYSDYGERTSV